MCELYLSSSDQPHFPEEELRRLQRHGGEPWTNLHGWGIAWLIEETAQFELKKSPRSALNAKGYDDILGTAYNSPLYLLHLRAASTGGVRKDNTQPYRFDWAGRPAIYMHNGELKNMSARLIDELGQDARNGTTDSEGGMLLLHHALQSTETLDRAWVVFKVWAQAIKSMGIANFIIALGDEIFVQVHRRKELGGDAIDDPGLYLSQTDDLLRLSSEPLSDTDTPLKPGTQLWINGSKIREQSHTT
ncbi:MAG: class II glutamine amidotransferase [Litorimonas sp.]